MAEIQNNITNSTQVQFQICPLKTNLGTPAAGNIVFIKDTNELYLDGTYYGLSAADAAALKTATTNIETLKTVTGLLTTYVTNLRKFADGETEITREGPVLKTYKSGVLQNITNVKDAIDELAKAVDALKSHQWTPVNKSETDPKFATSVKQEADGSIKVTYNDAMSTDVKRTQDQKAIIGGDTVEDALQTLKGNLDTTNQKVTNNKSAIDTIKGPEDQEGSIANAVKKTKDGLIGLKPGVWAENEEKTLTKLRDLIKANANEIQSLTGLDAEKRTQITNIINELKQVTDSEEGDFANTLLDKLLTLYGSPENGKYNVNGGKHTTLQEIITAIENEISAGDNTVTGKITTEINKLDATQRGQLTEADKVVDGKHVGVKVVEENGKLTKVTVVEDNIASASDLTALTATVKELSGKVNSQGGQLTWKVIS